MKISYSIKVLLICLAILATFTNSFQRKKKKSNEGKSDIEIIKQSSLIELMKNNEDTKKIVEKALHESKPVQVFVYLEILLYNVFLSIILDQKSKKVKEELNDLKKQIETKIEYNKENLVRL